MCVFPDSFSLALFLVPTLETRVICTASWSSFTRQEETKVEREEYGKPSFEELEKGN